MCGSMVDIQSPTAEIRRGKKDRKRKEGKIEITGQKYNGPAIKKLNPGLVTFYDIRPGNREGLFWFQHFIHLSFTQLPRHLPTYSQPQDPHGAQYPVTQTYITANTYFKPNVHLTASDVKQF